MSTFSIQLVFLGIEPMPPSRPIQLVAIPHVGSAVVLRKSPLPDIDTFRVVDVVFPEGQSHAYVYVRPELPAKR